MPSPFHPIIARAAAADAAAIHALQRLAYRSEAELCGDWTIPPLVEPLAATEQAIAATVVLKATVAGRIVGSVRGRMADAICHVGRLIVHPDTQGHGLGTRLMLALEDALPQARRFELFTSDRSERNLHLYAKLGYTACRTEPLSPQVNLIFLEKRRAEEKAPFSSSQDNAWANARRRPPEVGIKDFFGEIGE